MVCLQEKSFTEKDLLNLKLENLKLKDLELLQNQIQPGPFTKIDDVNQYMEDTSTAMRKDAEVFRLKKLS